MDKRVVFLSIAGTITEWMDYTLYGYLANIMALAFFPKAQLQQRLLWVFGIFASSFLLRPLGAILFGHYADRRGRKKAIILTILISGITTLGIGVLPSFARWGLASTVGLLLLRIVQSLAIAGENGATVFLLEHAKKSSNFYGSLIGTASSVGMFISALLVMLFTNNNLPAWSWRIPYVLGGVACIAVSFLRYGIDESPEFMKSLRQHKIRNFPLATVIKKHPQALLTTFCFAGFMGLYTYICNIYFHTYLITVGNFNSHFASIASTYGQIIAVCAIPLSGILADYYGKTNILMVGLASAIVIPPAMFMLAQTGHLYDVFLAMSLYGLGMGLSLAPMFKYLFDLFPTEVRYSGYTSAWNVSVAIFGGSAPLVAQWLTNHQLADYAGFYVSLSAIIALSVSLRLQLLNVLKRLRYRLSV